MATTAPARAAAQAERENANRTAVQKNPAAFGAMFLFFGGFFVVVLLALFSGASFGQMIVLWIVGSIGALVTFLVAQSKEDKKKGLAAEVDRNAPKT